MQNIIKAICQCPEHLKPFCGKIWTGFDVTFKKDGYWVQERRYYVGELNKIDLSIDRRFKEIAEKRKQAICVGLFVQVCSGKYLPVEKKESELSDKELEKVRLHFRDTYDLAIWEVSDHDWQLAICNLIDTIEENQEKAQKEPCQHPFAKVISAGAQHNCTLCGQDIKSNI